MTAPVLFTLASTEADIVAAAFHALDGEEIHGGCVWLRIGTTERQWVVTTSVGRFTCTINEAHAPSPVTNAWLPISDRILTFASLVDSEVGEVRLDDDALIISADGMSAAIDLVNDPGPEPIASNLEPTAFAVTTLRTFNTLLASARRAPSGGAALGTGPGEVPSPPMWLQIATDQIALHVDWCEVVTSRGTYRATAESTDGNATASIDHARVGAFLRQRFATDDLGCLGIGSLTSEGHHDRAAIWISTPDWEFVTWALDPLLERWDTAINNLLGASDVTVMAQRGTEWNLRVEQCDVQLALHHGHPDIARVTGVVATSLDASPAVLHELNDLNIAATVVRYFWADRTVRAVADVRCSELGALIPAIDEVVRAMHTYAYLLGPLSQIPADHT